MNEMTERHDGAVESREALTTIIQEIMRPIMEGIGEILKRNAEQMENIAMAMEAQKERLDRLERETMLKMPMTGKKAWYVNGAIRERAEELLKKKDGDDAVARRKLAAAIRKSILTQWGVGKVGELPDVEYATVMRQVATWMDMRTLSAIAKEAKARKEAAEEWTDET